MTTASQPRIPTITIESDSCGPVEIPDFARLFPTCTLHPGCAGMSAWVDEEYGDACETCLELSLTPRMAFFLHISLEGLGDELSDPLLYEAPARPDGTLEFDWEWDDLLPRVARVGRRIEWLNRFIQCFEDLRVRLARGQYPKPRCTGEEMALHIAIDRARDFYGDGVTQDVFGSWYESFPSLGAADEDFDWIKDILFEDEDVLMLFDPRFDGIESGSEIGDHLGVANLHPDEWFLPFRPDEVDLAA
jgi:hypothetical protein